jgi:outer membrane biosynthesis protein TonB
MEKVQKVMDRAVDFPQEARDLGITGTVKAQIEVGIRWKNRSRRD